MEPVTAPAPDDAAGIAALHELAAAFGVDTDYLDWRGEPRTVGADALREVLAALDIDASSAEACRRSLAGHQERIARAPLPACIVRRAGDDGPLPTRSAGRVELEQGRTLDVAAGAPLPADIPLGYHRLVLDGGVACPLIVTPRRLEVPPALRRRRAWGLTVQLYSAPSTRSWGIGDLADLRTLAQWTADEHGGDFVLINPVHAGDVVAPRNPSPYLPTSRRFADPLYLRIEDLPEYAAAPADVRAAVDALGAPLRDSRTAQVERDPAWAAKLAALELLHRLPAQPDRVAAYDAYREAQGAALDRFATWCVLCEQHGGDWRDWPAPLRDPAGPAVGQAADGHADRVDLYRWSQWLLDEQLGAVQDAARAAGMGVGIVHDVAVGVSPAGADAWANQDVMATTVTVGAPPDAYSQRGQDWQQPPWRPDRLAATGYAPFRDMFGTVLRHSGGLRVDHIIGLFRLWWIPRGRQALEGTYVHYDAEALIGILALEAYRAGAVLIGEDLGNVPPEARAHLNDRGVLGTSILWFENDADGPVPAERWRELCLASVTTHDLPPTAGFLAGDHVRLRDRLGLLTRPADEELAAATAEQQAWLDELRRVGLLGADPSVEDTVLALHRYLARTPALLRCLALTDAVGERRTQNQPGTQDEYPNWRIPLAGPDGVPLTLEQVVTDPRAARLMRAMAGPDQLSSGRPDGPQRVSSD